jgi:hypothetical protein
MVCSPPSVPAPADSAAVDSQGWQAQRTFASICPSCPASSAITSAIKQDWLPGSPTSRKCGKWRITRPNAPCLSLLTRPTRSLNKGPRTYDVPASNAARCIQRTNDRHGSRQLTSFSLAMGFRGPSSQNGTNLILCSVVLFAAVAKALGRLLTRPGPSFADLVELSRSDMSTPLPLRNLPEREG